MYPFSTLIIIDLKEFSLEINKPAQFFWPKELIGRQHTSPKAQQLLPNVEQKFGRCASAVAST